MQKETSREPEPQKLPLKVYQSIDLLTVAAPMPGLDPEDVDVEVTADGRLIVQARSCRDPQLACGALKSNKDVLLDEWSVGPYVRELALPEPVDGEAATLTYGNGVLVVALPLADRHRPARLRMAAISPSRGERPGRPDHPAHPRTPEEAAALGGARRRDA